MYLAIQSRLFIINLYIVIRCTLIKIIHIRGLMHIQKLEDRRFILSRKVFKGYRHFLKSEKSHYRFLFCERL